MALDTGYQISAQKVTKLPVSDVVIKRVEELAKIKVLKSLSLPIAVENLYLMHL